MVGRVAGVTTLAELLPIGVLLLDSTGRVIFANDTVCGMLNQQPLDLKHGGFEAFINPEDRGIVTVILGRLSATPGVEECTVRFLSARIERGECRFCSEGGTDVTCIAVTIEDVLQARFDRGDPTMVAFLDLDDFKAVNDQWGHARGDQVLVDVANALLAGVDPSAEIGRIGGDEFVVIHHDASTDGEDPAARSVEQWAAHLEDLVLAAVSVDGLAITCSVGIGRSHAGDTLRDLLHRADEAMYRAKGQRP